MFHIRNPRTAGSALARRAVILLAVSLCLGSAAGATGGVSFTDIAAGGGAGLTYERAPSASIAIFQLLTTFPVFTFDDLTLSPSKPFGAPGAALLDYDGDGDLDIYVTNGPDRANSLFENRLATHGDFLDVALAAGVDATSQDSSGVCFGDVDNDGDLDILVLSYFGANRLFENNGDGTFDDISATSGVGGTGQSSTSCSFGDVDNDGLLDVAIANAMTDMTSSFGIVAPFDFVQHNQVLRNLGGNQFADVSAGSGIRATTGFPGFEGSPTLTWAIALVDVDGDGDADLVHADDQGGVPFPRDGGINYGLIHVFLNDGSGHFTDITGAASGPSSPASPGSWMGLSFGDVDADGHLDLFGSNLGDYSSTLLTPLDPVYVDFFVYLLGDMTSRWYLGGPGGSFTDPGVGPLVATPFGWGTSMSDYDNDGDTDIFMHGGLYFGQVGQGSPASIFQNDGTGTFGRDAVAFAASTDHEERAVQGMAMGDLDGNGFDDIVSVSNFNVPAANQTFYNHAWGSPFDGGRYAQIFTPTGALNGDAFFSGNVPLQGTLAVELNDGANGKGSVRVRTLGTVGITSGGAVNRDGIGAVVKLTATSGRSVLRPVIGGASYASQDALEGTFGLGSSRMGVVEILWPGGVRNRLYDVRAGSRIVFPEIPCSFDGDWPGYRAYLSCIRGSLAELVDAGVIQRRDRARFFLSAVRAFLDAN